MGGEVLYGPKSQGAGRGMGSGRLEEVEENTSSSARRLDPATNQLGRVAPRGGWTQLPISWVHRPPSTATGATAAPANGCPPRTRPCARAAPGHAGIGSSEALEAPRGGGGAVASSPPPPLTPCPTPIPRGGGVFFFS